VHELLPLSLAACLWVGDDDLGGRQDSDQDGNAVGDDCDAAVGGCAPPSGGLADLAIGSRYDSRGGSWNGAVHVLDGTLRGNAKVLAASHVIRGGLSGRHAGRRVHRRRRHPRLRARVGLRGSGRRHERRRLAEILGGSFQADDGDLQTGASRFFFGAFTGSSLMAQTAAHLYGFYENEQAGTAVAGGSDVDQDGYDDLMFSVRYGGSNLEGATCLWLGGPDDE
jgi:hypothetical protein